MDVWQVTRDHVDVYFPTSTTPIPSFLSPFVLSETNISHVSFSQTHATSPGSKSTNWGLHSLENSSYHDDYHLVDEIDDFLYNITITYPDLATLIPVGHTFEQREMYALKLSRFKPSNCDACEEDSNNASEFCQCGKQSSKPGIFIIGAQHGREWIATATSLYLAHALVANYSEPRSISHLLDTYDFYIIPSPNPDGYHFTWHGDRFWYKNRMANAPGSNCVGVDMNRNWGYKWRPFAVSQSITKKKKHIDPCSHWYPGSRPFEAPEVNNIANFVTTLPNLHAFIDLRSYGQMLSTPFSYSCKKWPKDAEDQLEAAVGATHALRKLYGTTFQTGPLCGTLYRAHGNIVDWMYRKVDVKYSFAVHLRDTGTYGFDLPSKWIRPVGEETADMLSYLAAFIAKNERECSLFVLFDFVFSVSFV
ncbi:hypothetical protein SERLADRAFT_352486 [Serpula lacrymans var. lacrymans S7.9]|nr:uncharacterized protein SERLADRAFT_352486 [Serpula lacrymans var. lacrymans S7.9]EGO20001.1 hypothetical protein SERLADRAFT_352486 [Serpula lacrymans var. lacrymans S7.9]